MTTSATGATDLVTAARKLFDDASDIKKTSVTAAAKKSMIVSRVYIDGTTSDIPEIPKVVSAIQTLYLAFIMHVMGLTTLVTSGKKISDLLAPIATEDYDPDLLADLHSSVAAVEGFMASLEAASPEEQEWKDNQWKRDKEKYEADKQKKADDANRQREMDQRSDAQYIREETGRVQKPAAWSVDKDGNNPLPAGKIINVEFTNPQNGNVYKVPVIVQMNPIVIPGEVSVKFITKDITPTLAQRWIQFKAGEISFWRDFVFQVDRFQDRNRTVARDKSGVFDDFMATQVRKGNSFWARWGQQADQRSRNLANTVMIFNKKTIDLAKAQTGIDITNKMYREKYFAETFTMMIVIIDTHLNRVTMYFNGLDNVATYTFDQFSTSQKTESSVDLVKALMSWSQQRF